MLPPNAFTVLDWTVVINYFLFVLFIGLCSSKKQKSDKSFFLGNRSMPVWAVSLSIIATSLSAVTFIGAPQEAYQGDLSYLVLNIGGALAVCIVAVFFLPAFYRSNSLTIYGYLEQRFNTKVRIAAGITFLFGRLLASGARLFAAAMGSSLILYGTGEEHLYQTIVMVLILGFTGTLYTLSGGIKAVIWTDVLQIFVVIGSAVLSIVVLLQKIPLSIGEIIDYLNCCTNLNTGASKLTLVHTTFDWQNPYTIWTGTFAIVFLNMASYGVDQDLVQRMLTCKSAFRGGVSLILSHLLSICVVLLFMCIGLLLYLFSDPGVMGSHAVSFSTSELVYPQFLIQHLPPGISGLAIAGLLAASMSSLDSAINAMASSAIADIWRPLKQKTSEMEGNVFHSRVAVCLMGIALTVFAIFSALTYDPANTSLLGFALGVMSYAYAGLLGIFFTGLFTRRGNTKTVYAALIAGAATVFALQPASFGIQIAWPWWMVIGTFVSFTICCLGNPDE